MKYTESKDGLPRITYRVPLRFTKEQYEVVRKMAKQENTQVRQFLRGISMSAVEERLTDQQEEQQQQASN